MNNTCSVDCCSMIPSREQCVKRETGEPKALLRSAFPNLSTYPPKCESPQYKAISVLQANPFPSHVSTCQQRTKRHHILPIPLKIPLLQVNIIHTFLNIPPPNGITHKEFLFRYNSGSWSTNIGWSVASKVILSSEASEARQINGESRFQRDISWIIAGEIVSIITDSVLIL